MNIGLVIRSIRTQKGINIRTLSQKTGLNISNLSLIEQGKRQPQIDTVVKILDALGAELIVREKDGD